MSLAEQIKADHHFVYTKDGGYQPRCAECGKPHPCETWRTADGHPNWPTCCRKGRDEEVP